MAAGLRAVRFSFDVPWEFGCDAALQVCGQLEQPLLLFGTQDRAGNFGGIPAPPPMQTITETACKESGE